MQFVNTEVPSFSGGVRSDGSPAIVETMELKDHDGNVLFTFRKNAEGGFSLEPTGTISGSLEIADSYSEEGHSHQSVAADLEISATVGSDVGTDPKFIAPIMGNLVGEKPTNDSNYLAGVIGANSLDCGDSDYPTAAVMGVLFDGAQVDSIVLADLDGDDGGAATNARAAFGVKVNNNNPSSGCEFGLSLKDAGNANYTGGGNAFVPSKADVEFSNGLYIVALDTAITANSTTTDAPAGSPGITSHATGRGKLFMSDGSKWQFAVVA
jgi:hypothetical protein